MDFKMMDDKTLLEETKRRAQEERECLARVLHHMGEVYRRRVFSPQYPSFKEYLVRELGCSDKSAYKRIDAMRLLTKHPEIEKAIVSGKLNLTHLSMANGYINQEGKARGQTFSKEEQLSILRKIAGKSTREAEKILFSMSKRKKKACPDTIRRVSETEHEYRFTYSDELEAKLNRLKGLLAHAHPKLSMGELIDKLCDLGLKSFDPGKKDVRPRVQRTKVSAQRTPEGLQPQPTPLTQSQPQSQSQSQPQSQSQTQSQPQSQVQPQAQAQAAAPTAAPTGTQTQHQIQAKQPQLLTIPSPANKSIPAAIRREVWRRDQSQCVKCKSQWALEIDHRIPRALGGTNDILNLRLLCSQCNKRAAIEAYGVEKMQGFLAPSGSTEGKGGTTFSRSSTDHLLFEVPYPVRSYRSSKR